MPVSLLKQLRCLGLLKTPRQGGSLNRPVKPLGDPGLASGLELDLGAPGQEN